MSEKTLLRKTQVFNRNKDSEKKIIVNRGGTRCMAPDTLVLMGDYSYKQIKDILIGDQVMTRRGPQNVLKVYQTGEGQKNINIFVNGIKCTQNHRIYYRGEWLFPSIARERAMERISSEIHSFKSWENYCKKSSWGKNRKADEASSKSLWLSEYCFYYQQKISPHFSPSNSRRVVCPEPRKQTPNKSYQSRPKRQQGGQFGMGYPTRKYPAYDDRRQADNEQRDKERNEQNRLGNCSQDSGRISTPYCNKEDAGKKIWFKNSPYKGYCFEKDLENRKNHSKKQCFKGKAQTIRETSYSVEKRSRKWNEISGAGSEIWCFDKQHILRSISDLEASLIIDGKDNGVYYDLEVENDPTFFVSKDNILVHNSSKTYSLMQLAALFLFYGYVSPSIRYLDKGLASVVRKTKPALKGSALRDFEDILYAMPASQLVEQNKVDGTFKFQNRVVEFFSVDDQQKVRSRGRDILFCIEANELKYREDFIQMLLRTKYRTYMDFNPDREDIWIRTELEQKRAAERGDVDVIVSTWRDNIRNLTPDQIEEILYLEKVDQALYKVFGEGQYAPIQGHIFNNWQMAPYPLEPKNEFIGVDFGFNPDPVAVVQVCRDGSKLFAAELAYHQGWTNKDLIDFLKEHNQNHLTIIADSAEPKSIEELRRAGLRVTPSRKGPDSLRHGINLMQQYNLFITAESSNLAKELRNYIWSESKAHTPIDGAGDHLIDAVRYVVQTKYTKRKKIKVTAIR